MPGVVRYQLAKSKVSPSKRFGLVPFASKELDWNVRIIGRLMWLAFVPLP